MHITENKLNSFIKKKKINNILVITGKKSFNISGFKDLKIFKEFNSKMTIFYKKNSIPDSKELEFLIKKMNNINPDLIIALGGGCVLDYAKLANGLHNVKKLENNIKKNKIKIYSKKTKILAIPSTAGSGAEVTKFAVIYIKNIKYSVEHNLLKPDFYSLIPKLVIKSSKIVRVSAAFDAIAQASESIFSKKANSYSLRYASKSLHYSIQNFLDFVNKPNIFNSERMLKAANFSGMAINIAKTNTPHALSYFFTSRFKIPHGIAVSIFFIEVINFYYLVGKNNNNLDMLKRFNLFFQLINVKNILEFERLFNNFFLKSGIKKYLKKIFHKINYQGNNTNLNFYYDYSRLKNSLIKLSKKEISNLYLSKFNL